MKEDRLQFELILWYGQKYPQFQDLMFEINNDTLSAGQAIYRRSKGMRAGASDLGWIIPNSGKFVGIELKAPGSTHDVEHLKRQLEWGRSIVLNGGFYFMVSRLHVVKNFIDKCFDQGPGAPFLISEIDLKDYQAKTIKFAL